ncbi:mucin-16 isoform X2 [Zeugodacus cucurbitae]|uniref:mucin-16 isoform X2 n=1 Tax=Zeugodacus cucurbitae TaxID=28588 RepID=UPI0005968BF3|nr:mucin-16 isoform X2 [Zeugodacus cucurbitae]
MALDGAKFICLSDAAAADATETTPTTTTGVEAGGIGDASTSENIVIEAKGRKFTIGYYMNCDYVLEDPRAIGVHCEIQCDAFGRVTIHNNSEAYPVSVNEQIITLKRPLLDGSRIKILDRIFLWKFPKPLEVTAISKNSQDDGVRSNEDVCTPQKLVAVPEQAPNSCPDLKHHRKVDKRFTVHNFAYCINSDEEGNTSSELPSINESEIAEEAAISEIVAQKESNKNEGMSEEDKEILPTSIASQDMVVDKTTLKTSNVERRSITPEPQNNEPTIASTPLIKLEDTPKMNLINCTQNKENRSTEKKLRLLSFCQQSDVVITSFSPREAGVRIEKSFTAVVKPATLGFTTPKSVYSTPKSMLSDYNDGESLNFIDFATPATSKKSAGILARNSSMHLIDLTTPSKLGPDIARNRLAHKGNKTLPSHVKLSTTPISSDKLKDDSARRTPKLGTLLNKSESTPQSAESVISVDETSDSSAGVIEIPDDSPAPSTSSPVRIGFITKTPQRSTGQKPFTSTPLPTPQSLLKRAIVTSAKKQINSSLRTALGKATPTRQLSSTPALNRKMNATETSETTSSTPKSRISIGSPGSVAAAQRRSVSSLTRRSSIATTHNREHVTTPSSTSVTRLTQNKKITASTSRLNTGKRTSPLRGVRKSLGGTTLTSHISKTRRSVISPRKHSPTSIATKLAAKARKSFIPNSTNNRQVTSRARSLVVAAVSSKNSTSNPNTTAASLQKKDDVKTVEKTTGKEEVKNEESLEEQNEVGDLSRTFTVDDSLEEVEIKTSMPSTPCVLGTSTSQKQDLNKTCSPEKSVTASECKVALDVTVDIAESSSESQKECISEDLNNKDKIISTEHISESFAEVVETDLKIEQKIKNPEILVNPVKVEQQNDTVDESPKVIASISEQQQDSKLIEEQVIETLDAGEISGNISVEQQDNSKTEAHVLTPPSSSDTIDSEDMLKVSGESQGTAELLEEIEYVLNKSDELQQQLSKDVHTSKIEITNEFEAAIERTSSVKTENITTKNNTETDANINVKDLETIAKGELTISTSQSVVPTSTDRSESQEDASSIDSNMIATASEITSTDLDASSIQTEVLSITSIATPSEFEVSTIESSSVEKSIVSDERETLDENTESSNPKNQKIAVDLEAKVCENDTPLKTELFVAHEAEAESVAEAESTTDEVKDIAPTKIKNADEDLEAKVSENNTPVKTDLFVADEAEIASTTEEVKDIAPTRIENAGEDLEAEVSENDTPVKTELSVANEAETESIAEVESTTDELKDIAPTTTENAGEDLEAKVSENDSPVKTELSIANEAETESIAEVESTTDELKDITPTTIKNAGEDSIDKSKVEVVPSINIAEVSKDSQTTEEAEQTQAVVITQTEPSVVDNDIQKTVDKKKETEGQPKPITTEYQESETGSCCKSITAESKMEFKTIKDAEKTIEETKSLSNSSEPIAVVSESVSVTEEKTKPNGENQIATNSERNSDSEKENKILIEEGKQISTSTVDETNKISSSEPKLGIRDMLRTTKQKEVVASRFVGLRDLTGTPKASTSAAAAIVENDGEELKGVQKLLKTQHFGKIKTQTPQKTAEDSKFTPRRSTRRRSSANPELIPTPKSVTETDDTPRRTTRRRASASAEVNYTPQRITRRRSSLALDNEGVGEKASTPIKRVGLRAKRPGTIADVPVAEDMGAIIEEEPKECVQESTVGQQDFVEIQKQKDDVKTQTIVLNIPEVIEESICEEVNTQKQEELVEVKANNECEKRDKSTNELEPICATEKLGEDVDKAADATESQSQQIQKAQVEEVVADNSCNVSEVHKDHFTETKGITTDKTAEILDESDYEYGKEVMEQSAETALPDTQPKTPKPVRKSVRIADTNIAESPKTPVMVGMRELLKTPKDCRDTPKLIGVRELVRTPKTIVASRTTDDVDDVERLTGLADLMKTPKVVRQHCEKVEATKDDGEPSTSSKALSDFIGMRELLKTPKHTSTPYYSGMREMLRTPKACSTPQLAGVGELMQTPKRTKLNVEYDDKNEELDQFFKTPRAKNIMIPADPASAILEPSSDSSAEIMMAATTEYDLHSSCQRPLEDIYKTPVSARLTSVKIEQSEKKASEINKDRRSTDTTNEFEVSVPETPAANYDKPQKATTSNRNLSAEEAFDEMVGMRTILDDTPPQKVYSRKQQSIVAISPFSATDVISDLPKTDIQEWVDNLEQEAESVVEEQEFTASTSILDASKATRDPIATSIYEISDASGNKDTTEELLADMSAVSSMVDPLQPSAKKSPKSVLTIVVDENETLRPVTPINTEISGINLLDQTNESVFSEPLVVSDTESEQLEENGNDEVETEKTINKSREEFPIMFVDSSDSELEEDVKTIEKSDAKKAEVKSPIGSAKPIEVIALDEESSSDVTTKPSDIHEEFSNFQAHKNIAGQHMRASTPNRSVVQATRERRQSMGAEELITEVSINVQLEKSRLTKEKSADATTAKDNLPKIEEESVETSGKETDVTSVIPDEENPTAVTTASKDSESEFSNFLANKSITSREKRGTTPDQVNKCHSQKITKGRRLTLGAELHLPNTTIDFGEEKLKLEQLKQQPPCIDESPLERDDSFNTEVAKVAETEDNEADIKISASEPNDTNNVDEVEDENKVDVKTQMDSEENTSEIEGNILDKSLKETEKVSDEPGKDSVQELETENSSAVNQPPCIDESPLERDDSFNAETTEVAETEENTAGDKFDVKPQLEKEETASKENIFDKPLKETEKVSDEPEKDSVQELEADNSSAEKQPTCIGESPLERDISFNDETTEVAETENNTADIKISASGPKEFANDTNSAEEVEDEDQIAIKTQIDREENASEIEENILDKSLKETKKVSDEPEKDSVQDLETEIPSADDDDAQTIANVVELSAEESQNYVMTSENVEANKDGVCESPAVEDIITVATIKEDNVSQAEIIDFETTSSNLTREALIGEEETKPKDTEKTTESSVSEPKSGDAGNKLEEEFESTDVEEITSIESTKEEHEKMTVNTDVNTDDTTTTTLTENTTKTSEEKKSEISNDANDKAEVQSTISIAEIRTAEQNSEDTPCSTKAEEIEAEALPNIENENKAEKEGNHQETNNIGLEATESQEESTEVALEADRDEFNESNIFDLTEELSNETPTINTTQGVISDLTGEDVESIVETNTAEMATQDEQKLHDVTEPKPVSPEADNATQTLKPTETAEDSKETVENNTNESSIESTSIKADPEISLSKEVPCHIEMIEDPVKTTAVKEFKATTDETLRPDTNTSTDNEAFTLAVSIESELENVDEMSEVTVVQERNNQPVQADITDVGENTCNTIGENESLFMENKAISQSKNKEAEVHSNTEDITEKPTVISTKESTQFAKLETELSETHKLTEDKKAENESDNISSNTSTANEAETVDTDIEECVVPEVAEETISPTAVEPEIANKETNEYEAIEEVHEADNESEQSPKKDPGVGSAGLGDEVKEEIAAEIPEVIVQQTPVNQRKSEIIEDTGAQPLYSKQTDKENDEDEIIPLNANKQTVETADEVKVPKEVSHKSTVVEESVKSIEEEVQTETNKEEQEIEIPTFSGKQQPAKQKEEEEPTCESTLESKPSIEEKVISDAQPYVGAVEERNDKETDAVESPASTKSEVDQSSKVVESAEVVSQISVKDDSDLSENLETVEVSVKTQIPAKRRGRKPSRSKQQKKEETTITTEKTTPLEELELSDEKKGITVTSNFEESSSDAVQTTADAAVATSTRHKTEKEFYKKVNYEICLSESAETAHDVKTDKTVDLELPDQSEKSIIDDNCVEQSEVLDIASGTTLHKATDATETNSKAEVVHEPRRARRIRKASQSSHSSVHDEDHLPTTTRRRGGRRRADTPLENIATEVTTSETPTVKRRRQSQDKAVENKPIKEIQVVQIDESEITTVEEDVIEIHNTSEESGASIEDHSGKTNNDVIKADDDQLEEAVSSTTSKEQNVDSENSTLIKGPNRRRRMAKAGDKIGGGVVTDSHHSDVDELSNEPTATKRSRRKQTVSESSQTSVTIENAESHTTKRRRRGCNATSDKSTINESTEDTENSISHKNAETSQSKEDDTTIVPELPTGAEVLENEVSSVAEDVAKRDPDVVKTETKTEEDHSAAADTSKRTRNKRIHKTDETNDIKTEPHDQKADVELDEPLKNIAVVSTARVNRRKKGETDDEHHDKTEETKVCKDEGIQEKETQNTLEVTEKAVVETTNTIAESVGGRRGRRGAAAAATVAINEVSSAHKRGALRGRSHQNKSQATRKEEETKVADTKLQIETATDHDDPTIVEEKKQQKSVRRRRISLKEIQTSHGDTEKEGDGVEKIEMEDDVGPSMKIAPKLSRKRRESQHADEQQTLNDEASASAPTETASVVPTKQRGRRKRKDSHQSLNDIVVGDEPPKKRPLSRKRRDSSLDSSIHEGTGMDTDINHGANTSSSSTTPQRPRRAAAAQDRNYDESSDAEAQVDLKRRIEKASLPKASTSSIAATTASSSKQRSPTTAKTPTKDMVPAEIAEITAKTTSTPILSTVITTSRGRQRKPTARVQQYLEEERAKAETPKKRLLIGSAAVGDTPTSQTVGTPARRTRKASTVDMVMSETVHTPARSRTRTAKTLNVAETSEESRSEVEHTHSELETTHSSSHVEEKEQTTKANVAKRPTRGRGKHPIAAAVTATVENEMSAEPTEATHSGRAGRAAKAAAAAALITDDPIGSHTKARGGRTRRGADIVANEVVQPSDAEVKEVRTEVVVTTATDVEETNKKTRKVATGARSIRGGRGRKKQQDHEDDIDEHTTQHSTLAEGEASRIDALQQPPQLPIIADADDEHEDDEEALTTEAADIEVAKSLADAKLAGKKRTAATRKAAAATARTAESPAPKRGRRRAAAASVEEDDAISHLDTRAESAASSRSRKVVRFDAATPSSMASGTMSVDAAAEEAEEPTSAPTAPAKRATRSRRK